MACCLWCEKPFPPRSTGGTAQRFCSAGCRAAFHRAARQWALETIERGELTVAQIKNAPGTANTLVVARSPAWGVGRGYQRTEGASVADLKS